MTELMEERLRVMKEEEEVEGEAGVDKQLERERSTARCCLSRVQV